MSDVSDESEERSTGMNDVLTLLLLRHAKSSWTDAGLSDADRPLTGRGKRDAPRVGALLAERGLVPDEIVSSPAKRARKTAAAVAEACGYDGRVRIVEDLYLAGPGMYLRVVRGLPPECRTVLIVGHNPGLEEFLAGLTGVREALPTAALAQVVEPRVAAWSELPADGSASLVQVWRPRELD